MLTRVKLQIERGSALVLEVEFLRVLARSKYQHF